MPPLLIVIKKNCLHEFPKSLYTILFFLQCSIIVTIQQASGTFAKPLPSSEVLLMSRMSLQILSKYYFIFFIMHPIIISKYYAVKSENTFIDKEGVRYES